jgi:CheY-like chemotaxis protein
MYNVLIVDDSEDQRLLLRKVLNSTGLFRIVSEAGNGEVAVDYLGGVDCFANRQMFPIPDLLLLDLRMPRMDGFEVLTWLRLRQLKGMKVIVLSTSDLEEDIAKAKNYGADAYLVKGPMNEVAAEILEILMGMAKRPGLRR